MRTLQDRSGEFSEGTEVQDQFLFVDSKKSVGRDKEWGGGKSEVEVRVNSMQKVKENASPGPRKA